MALPTSIELRIVTPDRAIVQEQVDEVEIPGVEGYYGGVPGHTTLLAELPVAELGERAGRGRPDAAGRFRRTGPTAAST